MASSLLTPSSAGHRQHGQPRFPHMAGLLGVVVNRRWARGLTWTRATKRGIAREERERRNVGRVWPNGGGRVGRMADGGGAALGHDHDMRRIMVLAVAVL